MNKRNNKLLFLTLATLPAIMPIVVAQSPGDKPQPEVTTPTALVMQGDTIIAQNLDYLQVPNDTDQRPIYPTFTIARAYDDGIVVRWANSEYVPWKLSSTFGYTIVRTDVTTGDWVDDTLATEYYPLSLQGFMDRFGQQDSIAGLAAQLLYGAGAESTDGGSSFLDIYDEQQSRYADLMMVAEWRPDLAEAIGVRYYDRNVEPGHKYRYSIHSNVPDSVMRIQPGGVRIENIAFRPPKFRPLMTDTLTNDGHAVILIWENSDLYSAYDVERMREAGDGTETNPADDNDGCWIQINKNPFMTLATEDASLPEWNSYTDHRDLLYGYYQYRVRGYDPFGDKSEWSEPHRVWVHDAEPPRAPFIKYFEIHRDSLDRPTIADIHWGKDTIEADFAGFDVYYYHESVSDDWKKLNAETLAPTDSVYTASIVGLPSGYVIVSAVDKFGNQAGSVPYELDIEDMEPPTKPAGLRHLMVPDGTVVIGWNRNPETDVKGYQLYWANDPSHTFLQTGQIVRDTITVDSTAIVGVNQRYVYYGLKAIDYAGNQSEMSEIMRVARLNYGDVQPCTPDSIWQNDSTLFIDWSTQNGANVSEYRLYRTLEGEDNWTVVQIIDAEDVTDNLVHTYDSPLHNRTKRYYYCIETVGTMGQTAGKDHPISFWHRGPMTVDLEIDLKYEISDHGRLLMQWQPYGDVPIGNFNYVMYIRRSGESYFREYRSFRSNVQEFNYAGLQDGKTIEFYVTMRWPDGRRSNPSNTINVTPDFPKTDTNDNENQ